MSASFSVTYEARPFTANQTRRMHFHDHRRLVEEWKRAFAVLAHGQPRMEAATVTVSVALRGKRSQDVDAVVPAAKAALDGIVAAGVLDDDGPAYVRALTFLAPQFGAERDALTLTVRGVA